jgi:hypothetical protein
MDLPELLAAAGVRDVDALMSWARQRSAALIADLDPATSIGQRLAEGLARLDKLSVEVARARSGVPSAGASRTNARVVTRPYLGAAVEAALSGTEPSIDLPPKLAEPPAPAPEDDPSIGGFTRFAHSVRRRSEPEPVRVGPTLQSGWARYAEAEARGRPVRPFGDNAESGIRAIPLAANLHGDGEASASLVLGIPDEESADVPLPRPRPPSDAAPTAAQLPVAGPRPTRDYDRSFSIDLSLEDDFSDDPELSAAMRRALTDRAASEASASKSAAETRAAVAARPPSGPRLAASRPPSAPQPAASRPPSAPQPAAPVKAASDRPPTLPPKASDRPPTLPPVAPKASDRPPTLPPVAPAKAASDRPPTLPPIPPRRPATLPPPPAAAPPAAAPPAEAPGKPAKRGKSRKKVVDLSTPVARAQPVSTPSERAPPAPLTERAQLRPGDPAPRLAPPPPRTEASRELPTYLHDDDDD